MTTEAADAWKMWTQTEVDTILMVVSEGIKDPDVFLAEMQKRTGFDRSPAAYIHRLRVLKDSGHMVPLELVSGLQRTAKDRSNGNGSSSGDSRFHSSVRWGEAEHAAFVRILSGSIGKSGEVLMEECRQAEIGRTASAMRNRIDLMKRLADNGGVSLDALKHSRLEFARLEVSEMTKRGTLGVKPRKTSKAEPGLPAPAKKSTRKQRGRVVPPPQAGSMFTPDQAAKRYRCSPGLLRKLATRGLVKRLAIGAYDAESVHAYFETHARWPLAKDRADRAHKPIKPVKPTTQPQEPVWSTIPFGDRCGVQVAVSLTGLSRAMVQKLGHRGLVRRMKRNGDSSHWYSRSDLVRYSKMSYAEKRNLTAKRAPSPRVMQQASTDLVRTKPASRRSPSERNAVAGAQMETAVSHMVAIASEDLRASRLTRIKWVLDGIDKELLDLPSAIKMIRQILEEKSKD